MILDWDLLVFMGALGIAAFSPGPGLAAVVATVLAGGAKRALWFCGGVILGDLAWLALSLSGLAVIAQQVPVVFTIIKWVGVAYLAYLAVRIWRAPAGGNPAATSHAGGQNALTRLLTLDPVPACRGLPVLFGVDDSGTFDGWNTHGVPLLSRDPDPVSLLSCLTLLPGEPGIRGDPGVLFRMGLPAGVCRWEGLSFLSSLTLQWNSFEFRQTQLT